MGTQTTQLLVQRIIRMVLETGTVTGTFIPATRLFSCSSLCIHCRPAFFAVVLLVLTMLPDHISYYQVPAAMLALLYSNSMLALLNSRINLNACKEFGKEPPPQTECQLAALRFCKSPRESGITGINSIDPSMRTIGVTRHLSFLTEDSRRISGPAKVCLCFTLKYYLTDILQRKRYSRMKDICTILRSAASDQNSAEDKIKLISK